MPLYTYECRVCGIESELFQRVGDLPPLCCDECGAADSMTRTIRGTSFQLKGGGWAKDNYGTVKVSDK